MFYFVDVLHHTTWSNAKRMDIAKEVTVVLCGVGDWNGGRYLRRRTGCSAAATAPPGVRSSSPTTSSSSDTSPLNDGDSECS